MKRYILALLASAFITFSYPAQAVVSSTENIQTHTGNAVTTEFPFPFIVYDEDDLEVTVNGAAVSANDYTITGLGEESGVTVTFDTAPANAAAIILHRVVPYLQDTDLNNFDGNPADVTEKQFDLIVMQAQQLAEQQGRSIHFPLGDTKDAELPSFTTRAGKVLIFDADGDVDISDTDWDDIETGINDIDDDVAAAAASASSASSSASAAATSAAASATSAATLSGTSTTSVLIATGTKSFTTQSGKQFSGQMVLISSSADSANYMHGNVTSYSGTSLTVNVTNTGGTGTFSDWVISVSGTRGATGATGATGPAGSGSGDVLASNNGSEYTASASTFRTNIGLGTIATQNSNGVTITGGTITGITDVAIADGGTAASTAAAGFDNLKQAATATYTGVVELATAAEAVTGTDTTRAVTPEGVAAAIAAAPSTGVWSLVEAQTGVSGVATITFDDIDEASCAALKLVFQDVEVSTSADIYLRTSTDNGSSFAGGSNNYSAAISKISSYTAPTVAYSAQVNTNRFPLSDTITTSTDELAGEVTLLNPSNATSNKVIFGEALSAVGGARYELFGHRASTADVDALLVGANTGNMSGNFYLYCLSNS